MPAANPDVLVVGAGPVGLTMAAELARHDLTCRLIDKAAAPSDKSKALVVWSRSMEMLDTMGAARPFVDAGLQAHGANLFSGGERLVHVSFEADSPYNYALMLPQCDIERLLAEHAGRLEVRVERETELIGFSVDEQSVTSRLRHADGREEQVCTPWLIGCDGAHSAVRHGLGITFSGSADPSDWMLADLRVAGDIPTDEISIFFHKLGVLAFFPITGGRFRIIADLGTTTLGERPKDPTLDEVQQTVDERGPDGLTVSNPIWLAGFRINERMVEAYRHGRVFLAGDAAHIHSPAGGQGMNTGMQDAYNLAWKLALVQHGHAKDLLLDSYSQERTKVGRRVLRNATIMTKAGTLRSPMAQTVRDSLYRIFGSLQLVQSEISNTLSEFSINYRRGPITGEHSTIHAIHWFHSGGGVKAGDRAPDAELIDRATGQSTRLFDLFRSTEHVLLLISGDTVGELDGLRQIKDQITTRFGSLIRSYLIAPREMARVSPNAVEGASFLCPGELRQRYGVQRDTLYLIRPDRYVGFRSQPADGTELVKHLEKYLR